MTGLEAARIVVEGWPKRDLSQPDPSSPLWLLRVPGLGSRDRGRVAGACQQEFFSALGNAKPPVYIHHPDSPLEQKVPGVWELVAEATWRVPESIDVRAEETRRWLFDLGNWTVYGAAEPVAGTWPDPFRTKPHRLIGWMEQHGVGFLVDSFHDDTDWLIAIPGWIPQQELAK